MLLHILQIGKCIIAIEHDRTAAIIAVKKALDDLADERFQLALVHAIYPEGGERQLIEVLSGQQVPSDGLPVDIGYLCQNVATAYAVYDAFNNGQALTSRVVSVGGKGIRKPQNLLVPTGTSIKDVVDYCGGFEEGDYRLIVGGPMMGFTIPTTEVPVDKATNSILALPIDETRASHPVMPCIRCGDCATVCPASLLPQELYWHARGDTNIDGLKRLHVFDCIECGCCDYVCPSNLPLTQYFRFAKDELWYREARKKLSEHARDRFEDREQRLLQAKLERDERRILRKKQLADQTSRQQEIQAAVKRAAAREKNTSEKGQ